VAFATLDLGPIVIQALCPGTYPNGVLTIHVNTSTLGSNSCIVVDDPSFPGQKFVQIIYDPAFTTIATVEAEIDTSLYIKVVNPSGSTDLYDGAELEETVEGGTADFSSDFAGSENPLSEGGNWVKPASWTAMKKVTGNAGPSANEQHHMSLRSGSSGSGQFSAVTLSNNHTGVSYAMLGARFQGTGAGQGEGYILEMQATEAAAQLYRVDETLDYHPLGSAVTGHTWNSGDTVVIHVDDDVVRAYHNLRFVVRGDDAAYATGLVGIGGWLSGALPVWFASWEGGSTDVAPAAGAPTLTLIGVG
jgi:hypothetical protein